MTRASDGSSPATGPLRDPSGERVQAALLLGDSIRIGYQAFVAAALRDWQVAGPEENGRSSRDLAGAVDRYLEAHAYRPTIVHFNAGLHDLRRRADTEWRHFVSLPDYVDHLDAIFSGLVEHRFVGPDRVIVATTTPVDPHQQGSSTPSLRSLEDVAAYNQVLRERATVHGAAINDLFTAVVTADEDLLGPDGVHFTASGYRFLGTEVARAISMRADAISR